MKASKRVVEKALFHIIAIPGLWVALSACAEPRGKLLE